MNKRALFLCFILVIVGSSAGFASTLHFPENGFTVKVLEGTSDTAAYQVLAMSLPRTPDGFTPNVNIMVQPNDRTLAEYIALLMNEARVIGLDLINITEVDDVSATLEFAGELFGLHLRRYTKVVLGNGKRYVITASASEPHWDEVADQLIETVESFRLD